MADRAMKKAWITVMRVSATGSPISSGAKLVVRFSSGSAKMQHKASNTVRMSMSQLVKTELASQPSLVRPLLI